MRNSEVKGISRALLGVMVVVIAVGTVGAQEVEPLVLPAAASVSGLSGEWRTELIVWNPNDITITVRLDFVLREPTPGSKLYQFQLEPNRTRIFPAIVGDTLDMPGMAGALTVSARLITSGAEKPVEARARLYNTTVYGVYGQGSMAQDMALVKEADQALLLGLTTNSEQYTNLALARPFGAASTLVLVDLLTLDGGVLATEVVSLGRAAFFTNVRSSLFGLSEPEHFSLRVRQPTGTMPAVLASVVERDTGDATTVEPILRQVEEDEER